MEREFSVVMIKPDAVQSGLVQKIEEIINQNGLRVIRKKIIKADRKFILDLWPKVVGYEGRLERSLVYLSESPLLIWLVCGPDALGKTIKIKKNIRREYSRDDFYTLLHCPDTLRDFLREYAIFFSDESLTKEGDINCNKMSQIKGEEVMKTNKQVEVFLFKELEDKKIIFLVLKRISEKGGFWQPITGNVQEGENFEEAAHRETQEETMISNILRLVDTGYAFDFFDDDRQQTEQVFGAQVDKDAEITLSREHTDFQWVTEEEALDKYLKWPGNKEGLRKLSSILRGGN
ncbi:MAG: NUDIX domain-containing protein [Patescibacteria group bacterium]